VRKANFFLALLVFLLVLSCSESSKQTALSLPAATGKINTVAVIIDDVLWNGEIGDTLRKKLAAPVDGLQEEEPMFTLNQFSPRIFDATVKTNRTIVVISKSDFSTFKHVENQFANPQNVFYISGHSISEICQTIDLHSETLINSIKFYEIIEQQRMFMNDLLDDRYIRERFGFTIQIPAVYKYAVNKSNFLWLKKDTPSGNSSLVVYPVPADRLEHGKDFVTNLIQFRDSICGYYIKGMADNAKMVTEESYAPYVTPTIINHRKAIETRGNWELQQSFMNGPFVNYAIKDAQRNRYIIVEGFVYNPSSTKRDMLFELEAIIKSLHFLQ